MKNLLLSRALMLLLLFTGVQISAQVSINTDGSQPDGSAMLDVKSSAKGVLVPRMTFEDRNAIVNPAKGLMVFCTNLFHHSPLQRENTKHKNPDGRVDRP